MEGLLTRRSVRRYTDKPVSERDIIEIIRAGMYAPSARNQQVWDFLVITDKKLLKELSARLETAPMAKNAAFAVLVCADAEREKSEGYWEQDCGACIENMMLAPCQRESVPFGSESIPEKNVSVPSKKCLICPTRSVPIP